MESIPIFGPFLGGLTATVVAFLHDPQTALWVAVAALAIQQIEGNLILRGLRLGRVEIDDVRARELALGRRAPAPTAAAAAATAATTRAAAPGARREHERDHPDPHGRHSTTENPLTCHAGRIVRARSLRSRCIGVTLITPRSTALQSEPCTSSCPAGPPPIQ